MISLQESLLLPTPLNFLLTVIFIYLGQPCCMRKFPPYFSSLLLHFLLLTFSAKSQLQKIYLNPKAPGSEKQSQFVDSIRFVPLQVMEDIDVSNYNYVQVTKDYFLLTDYPNKRVFLYHKNGSLSGAISYKRLGDGMYPMYDAYANRLVFFGGNKNYSLTPKDRILIRLDWKNPRNKKYFKKYTVDLGDTSYLLRKEEPTENDIAGAYPFYGGTYWQTEIVTSPLYKDSLDYELKLYKNNQLVKGFFPYNRINETRYLFTEKEVSFTPTDNPEELIIARPFCDTLYRLAENNLHPAYQLVLPLENSLPSSFFTKPFATKTERENFERNNGWLFNQVRQFYETPRFLLLSVGYLQNYDSYVYVKGANSTYKTSKIKADSSQYNLSLLAGFGTSRHGNRFYRTVKAEELISFFAEHKTATVPKELEEFLKRKPPADALVVVEFKLKN